MGGHPFGIRRLWEEYRVRFVIKLPVLVILKKVGEIIPITVRQADRGVQTVFRDTRPHVNRFWVRHGGSDAVIIFPKLGIFKEIYIFIDGIHKRGIDRGRNAGKIFGNLFRKRVRFDGHVCHAPKFVALREEIFARNLSYQVFLNSENWILWRNTRLRLNGWKLHPNCLEGREMRP